MHKEIIIERIEKLKLLNSESKPLWGIMTSQNMIEHLILSVKLGNGGLTIECKTPTERLPIFKRFLFSSRPFPKNYISPATGKALLPLEFESISVAIQVLQKETEKFFDFFKSTPAATLVNPTYGELNYEEWIQFHKRHFDHHLSQFGLIPV